MRTVKEISDLTGISVRTLHYYDEIGLLKPTEKSDAGYRLFDDKAFFTITLSPFSNCSLETPLNPSPTCSIMFKRRL